MASMIKADETLEKLLIIEKAVRETATLRQRIIELRESEAERQKALDELRAKEMRQRILWENLPQQTLMKDKDSVYIFCSQSYAAALKRKPEDIIGKTDEKFYPRAIAEKYRLEDKRVLTTGQAEDAEESIVRDEQSFVVRRVKTPLRDEKGEIIGILGVSWDITEQRRREDELRKNCERLEESVAGLTAELQWKSKLLEAEKAERKRMEEHLQGTEGLRKIFQKMVTPLIWIEENKVISMANAEFENLSGYSREEVEGKKCLMDFFGQTDSDRITEIFATQGENPDAIIRDKEFQLLDKGGGSRDISLTLYVVPGTKRRVASLTEITRTRKTGKGGVKARRGRSKSVTPGL